MKIKRLSCAVMAICVLCVVIATSGCSKSRDETDKDGNKQIELKWVFMGPGEQQDSQEVWSQFNKQLDKAMPGVSVNFQCISGADYQQKWKLMAAANEKIDIAWTGYAIPFLDEVKKGSYMQLDDLIANNAPDLKDIMPETVWDKEKVNGKLYAIPNYQMEIDWSPRYSFALDLVDKYKIDVDGLEKYLHSKDTITKDVYDTIEKYLAIFKQNGDLKLGVCPMFHTASKGYLGTYGPFFVKANGNDNTMYNIYETEEYKAYIQTMADWFKKGYIRKDILTAYTTNIGKTEADTSNGGYCFMGNGDVLYDRRPSQEDLDLMKADNYQAKVPYYHIPLYDGYRIETGPASTATVIPRTSKNPEAAIKLIDLINTTKGKDLYNLLIWGIEGKHYKKINDERIETIGYKGQPTSDSSYGLWKWVMGNTFNSFETQADKPNYNDYILELNKKSPAVRISGFNPNIDSIQDEVTQINAIEEQYKMPLASGALPDLDAKYNEFISKLKSAGADNVKADLQKQINEWVEKNKK